MFAKPTSSQLDYTVTDCVAGITQLTVNWDGQPYLQNATQRDLFGRCNANGLKASWSEFNFYRGSVICLIPGIDFPLPAGVAPGLERKTTFTCTANVTNLMNRTFTFDLYVIMVHTRRHTHTHHKHRSRAARG